MSTSPADASDAALKRTVIAIAAATGSTSMLVNVWLPFLPLFLLQVGAKDEPAALFWVAVGLTAQGVGRLLGGPLWGLLSDRLGRKKMFVRSVYCAALTAFVLSVINAPWQVAIALGLQGLLSGFVPASIALTSVSVPDAEVKRALSIVAGGQYLGGAIGPGVGAVVVIALGYRGAIFSSGVLIAFVATAIAFLVPADRLRKAGPQHKEAAGALAPFKPTLQFALSVFLYFCFFAVSAFAGIATPFALKQIAGPDVTSVTGLTFALSGVAAALGVWMLSGGAFRRRRLRSTLVVTSGLAAAAFLLLAMANSVWLYVPAFALASFLNASMMPATNTMIAFNVGRERRGTAFGIAAGAQALAFMAGPMTAAMFAAISLKAGFLAVSGVLVALTALVGLGVREPAMSE